MIKVLFVLIPVAMTVMQNTEVILFLKMYLFIYILLAPDEFVC